MGIEEILRSLHCPDIAVKHKSTLPQNTKRFCSKVPGRFAANYSSGLRQSKKPALEYVVGRF